jgi:membrane protein required for colicin V production
MIKNIDLNALTNFDWIIIGLIALSSLFGLLRGFMRSALSVFGWVVSAIIALKYGSNLSTWFENYLSASTSLTAAKITLFVIVAIAVAILNSLLISSVSRYFGGPLDHSAGFAFGFARGCVFAVIFFFGISQFFKELDVVNEKELVGPLSKAPSWIKGSQSLLLLKRGSDALKTYVPKSIDEKINEALDETTPGSLLEKFGKNNEVSGNVKANQIASMNKLLKSIPEEVLNNIADEEIILLQDVSAKPEDKVEVLNKIASEYYKISQENANSQKLSKQELKDFNNEYQKLMSLIDDEIVKYNKLIESAS